MIMSLVFWPWTWWRTRNGHTRSLKEDSLNRSFYRFALYVTHHPTLTIMLSVFTLLLLSYPTLQSFFLRPHEQFKIWNSSPLDTLPPATDPGTFEVVLRQMWIQGRFMGVLDREVLDKALKIEEAMMETMVRKAGERGVEDLCETCFASEYGTCFMHSPFLYWEGGEQFRADPDYMATIREGTHRVSPWGVTLRWGTVFAGKYYDPDHQLIAADAAVVGYFFKREAVCGEIWYDSVKEMRERGDAGGDPWDLHYPRTPESALKPMLLEYRLTPLTTVNVAVLSAAYAVTFGYMVTSLRRLRAVQSRVGLAVSAVVQVVSSLLAASTLLSLFGKELELLPREVYPFVVIVIGVENMFRLTNAVIRTPSSLPASRRVATAMGNVGASSLMAVSADLAILVLLAMASVTAVREFCMYAAVAIVVDFILHMTYFVAILSVDIRRLEMKDYEITQEGDQRVRLPIDRRGSMDGELSMRGRLWAGVVWVFRVFGKGLAGSIILLSFVVALNLHYNMAPVQGFLDYFTPKFWRIWWRRPAVPLSPQEQANLDAAPANQIRSFAQWISMQMMPTVSELLTQIAPNIKNFLVEVHYPTYFVVDKDRKIDTTPLSNLDSAAVYLWACVRNHFRSFMTVSMILGGGIIIVLRCVAPGAFEDVQYELDVELDEGQGKKRETLEVANMDAAAHKLDVVMLQASTNGQHLVSVGLDRRILLWDLWGKTSKSLPMPKGLVQSVWPLRSVSVDDEGRSVVAVAKGCILWWNVLNNTLPLVLPTEKGVPMTSFFVRAAKAAAGGNVGESTFASVYQPGTVVEYTSAGGIVRHPLGSAAEDKSAVTCTYSRKPALKVFTSLNDDTVEAVKRTDGGWTLTHKIPAQAEHGGAPTITKLIPVDAMDLVIVGRSAAVDIYSTASGDLLHTIETGEVKDLRATTAPATTCSCGFKAMPTLTIAYTEVQTGAFVMRTLRCKDGPICLRPHHDPEANCLALYSAEESSHKMKDPGQWQLLDGNFVIGLKSVRVQPVETAGVSGALRRRGQKSSPSKKMIEEEKWEAWAMMANGDVIVTAISHYGDDGEALLFNHLGPVCKIGRRSLVVGFGSCIKLITFGRNNGITGTVDHETHEEEFADGLEFARRRQQTRRGYRALPLV
ncbi:hypothetical protein SAICODRAFT_73387 [Saitoella complicata NRRL Y-17804]|uniref:Sterol regulatory element-binding protein cleavage-activating protein n=1 Tax=Saitoella complicata (strain BCRC 22490 / CBS 7301 / JCM 7358 / NBRC 10748 / NRRL Y-17804) TaxID=698492 RepID=A0A0E9NNT5_SAICN|nr:uncharacterized protein SAICODRAFT_73387 [Saitoella complicata NRRL Y-17804]ODQ50335.1 hypothetical protein SAICODRAFT_73387 [Saitoella complicata NRRL Y-17804]GAO51085.1 hypothetical protein G7K_5197-t1 [Saitoella complicata NRRL Y-17804]